MSDPKHDRIMAAAKHWLIVAYNPCDYDGVAGAEKAKDTLSQTVTDALALAAALQLQREHDDIRAQMGDSLFMREYLRQRREDIQAEVERLRAKLEVTA